MDGLRNLKSPLRFLKIPGFDQRTNDIVYCYPYKLNDTIKSVVVFFGGDVQDFTENMQSHRDNKNYVKWNLENTAQLLRGTFMESHIMVVKPSRMEFKTFSCYEHFVPSNNCGVPDHVPMHNALKHLEFLIENLGNKLQTATDVEIEDCFQMAKNAIIHENDSGVSDAFTTCQKSDLDLTDCNIKLIGFSKGCVVLNQFIHEFHYYETLRDKNLSYPRIIEKITDIYWLDGGHSGGKNTWVTSKLLLETLAKLGIKIHVHVTPYQINDDRRPWIKKEEKQFCDTLHKLGAALERKVHFENTPASLLEHFNVLREFSG